jgi:alkanesulfonate monooxygenase SsuD/methylene tetrahydromethanopterin reductase-like flavin-dependent oxidoreductase (luciferase family)
VTSFGVHTGVQNTTVSELRDLWAGAEELGFDAISVWDHLYSSDLTGYECHEAVAIHAALACATTTVRCGCLVYCAGYRHPGVLAKAVTTIDHLSGGRVTFAAGIGYSPVDFTPFGEEWSARVRAERLDEGLDIAIGLAEAGGRRGGGVLATGSVTMAADVRLLLGAVR